MFNILPVEAHTVEVTIFKSRVKGWLLERPFYEIEEYFNSDMTTLVF